MGKVISIASQKGGVAKTTTAISISAGLAHKGKKVLLIDNDAQANSSKVLLENYPEVKEHETIYRTILDKKPLPIHRTKVNNLFIVPSHILLSETDVKLASAMDHREARLKRHLDPIKEQYDYIFIDCPPALGFLTLNAFTASDELIIVVSVGYFELDSIKQIGETISFVKENFNSALKTKGFLFTMSEPTVSSRDSFEALKNAYGNMVFKTAIPRNTAMKEAHFNRVDIFTHDPKASSAVAYSRFIEEVFV